MDGGDLFETEPGMCGRSWGYSSIGDIGLNDEMDGQSVQRFKIGDSVGCHFDKIKEVAFFTLNGQILGECLYKPQLARNNPNSRSGKPIADLKGKFIPVIRVGQGDHIRTNFGDKPLTHEVPTLTAEIMRDLWKPNPFIHIAPQECEPNC